jgi:hypothetical protein
VVTERDIDVELNMKVSSAAAVLDDGELLFGEREQDQDDVRLPVVPGDRLMLN